MLRRNLDRIDGDRRTRNRHAVLAQAGEVHLDRLAEAGLGLVDRCAGRDASRKVRHMRRPAASARVQDDRVGQSGVPHSRIPDCLTMFRRVPGARSSLGFPATVTRPGRNGCFSWRWLPRTATSRQPASWSRRWHGGPEARGRLVCESSMARRARGPRSTGLRVVDGTAGQRPAVHRSVESLDAWAVDRGRPARTV